MLLFLNDVAGSEVLLIMIFVLMFFGSKSIPSIARTFGKTVYQIKQASNDLQDEIKKSGLDIKKDLDLSGIIKDTPSIEQTNRPLDQQMVDMEDIVSYNPPKPLPIDSVISTEAEVITSIENSDPIKASEVKDQAC